MTRPERDLARTHSGLPVLFGAVVALGLPAIFCPLVSCVVPTDRLSQERRTHELQRWWTDYKTAFLQPDGRVVRPRDGNDTVSESQAYGLLFSVLLGERDTFERIQNWTRVNLSRTVEHGDSLLAWRWKDGKVLDWNSASDADLDYALALLLAHRRWRDRAFLEEAERVGRDILANETRRVPGLGTIMLPGSWEQAKDGGLSVNPSYFSPAAFRLLHQATGEAVWVELAAASYALWERSGRKLGDMTGAGLAPDWCVVTEDGRLSEMPDMSSSYGWEALRVPMRAGLDAVVCSNRQAETYLREGPVRFFRQWFASGHRNVAAVYSHAGRPKDTSESLAMTATALFAFRAAGEEAPSQLVKAFNEQIADGKSGDDYYGQSLAFFPLAYEAGVFHAAWLRR